MRYHFIVYAVARTLNPGIQDLSIYLLVLQVMTSKPSLGSSLIIFPPFYFSVPWSKMTHVNINRNQKRTTDTFDVVYFYSLIFLEY